ncbi:MAG: flavodoxin [Deltaproteobacteria bacterium ADurb.Bin510]|nr:MAG: flavodoxin [Deltaproteobacteria bacterium ADurb.Bin510]
MNNESIVIYDSYSGNTQKVAEKIAEGLGCEAVSIRDFKVENLERFGLIVIGSPINGGKATKRIKGFVRAVPSSSKYALFCTFGAPGWGSLSCKLAFYFLKNKTPGQFVASFRCRGYHQILKTFEGHPNGPDLAAARSFGANLKSVLG